MRTGLASQLLADRSLVIVVSGPSGAGKTVVVDELCNRRRLRRSVSVTTRSPRVGELDGRDYHFTKAASFERRIRDGGFAEWARYGPHYYGTPRAALDQAQEAGEDIVLTIDVQGGAQIRARYPEAVLVFMLPPDLDTLAQRLRDRGSETDEAIGRRLEALPDEIRAAAMYDYTVNNCGTVEQAAAAMNSIVEAEHMRMSSLRADRCARFQLTESTQ